MKKIKFTCISCQAKLRVPTHLAGVSAPCPKCGAMITAPTDISGAVEDESPGRRTASAEVLRGRQNSYSSSSGGRSATAPVAAAAVAGPLPTSEAAGYPSARQTRPVRPPSYGHDSPLDREDPIPMAATPVAPVPAPASVEEPEDPYVVVEVLNVPVEQPPPLAPITQPIQVNQRSGLLPEIRNETTPSPASLPRLDFSLAGQEAGSASSLLFSDQAGQPGRMVVKLPQPGAGDHQYDPQDFIIQSVPQEDLEPELEYTTDESAGLYHEAPLPDFEAGLDHLADELPPISLDEIEPPSYQESPPDIADFDEAASEDYPVGEMIFADPESNPLPTETPGNLEWSEGDISPVSQAPVGNDLPWKVSPGSASGSESSNRTLSTDWQSMETQPIPTLGSLKLKRSDEGELDDEAGFEGNSLLEGSVGKLFVRQPGREDIPSERQSQTPLSDTIDSSDLKNEGEVLDELFGGPSASPKGMSKTAVVALCGIGGAAIIATVVVIFLINLMGGLDPQSAYSGVEESSESSSRDKNQEPSVILEEPSIDGAPVVIDPAAMLREESPPPPSSTGEIPTPPAEAVTPATSTAVETPALSFDERVARVVNGTDPLTAAEAPAATEIKKSASNPVDSAISSFRGATANASPAPAQVQSGSAGDSAPAARSASSNHNPPASFAAPGPDESPLRNTNDLIDAFLRAPDWETRIKYTYQGDSLRPAIGDYYGKWADTKIDRFSLQLFQMEKNPSLGGPFWVYLVSTSDEDQGFPLIVRVEEGNLKVDWQIYSEFFDRHFVRFRDGKMPRPSTFRVVVERVSDYYGSDREGFKDLASYNVYQVNPPYGELDEFSEYAFVKKDSELAKKLDAVVGLNDEPLAVIITLDEVPFAHGVKHYLITEYVTEGWFR